MEPILDPYLPPSDHDFRHEYVHGGKKPHFSVTYETKKQKNNLILIFFILD